ISDVTVGTRGYTPATFPLRRRNTCTAPGALEGPPPSGHGPGAATRGNPSLQSFMSQTGLARSCSLPTGRTARWASARGGCATPAMADSSPPHARWRHRYAPAKRTLQEGGAANLAVIASSAAAFDSRSVVVPIAVSARARRDRVPERALVRHADLRAEGRLAVGASVERHHQAEVVVVVLDPETRPDRPAIRRGRPRRRQR